ncbi:MAG: 3D domain-containing protein [Clostridia bacterium]|nr:3D domain-containing protein [Clostridia bacterium]
MKYITLKMRLCRFVALCVTAAAVFTAAGVLIGRAFAQGADKPNAAAKDTMSNSAADGDTAQNTAAERETTDSAEREQSPFGQSAGYSQALAERELRIEETYGYTQFTATAYCKCRECNGIYGTDKPDGQAESATGAELSEGESIAADFSVLPPFTQVEISGMGIYTVHDCGSAIKGNRIDIYFENHEDAQAFGVQTVWVRTAKETA